MAQSDVFEVSFVTKIEASQCATILHLEQTDTGDPPDPNSDVWDAIELSGILALWQARTSDQAMLDCVKIQRIQPTRGLATYEVSGLVGAIGSQSMAPALSSLHFWQAPPFNRTNKCVKRWPGVPEIRTKWGRLTEDAMADEIAFAAAFNDPMTGAPLQDYQWGVYSRKYSTFEALGFSEPRTVLHSIRNRRPRLCI